MLPLTLLALLLLAPLALVASPAAAAVTTGATDRLTFNGQLVRDDQTGFAVFGFGAVDGGAGDTLTQVDVEFIDDNNFAIPGELEPFTGIGSTSGLALYRDNSNVGVNDDVLDGGDIPVALGGAPFGIGGDTFRILAAGEGVPNAATGSYEWFVVIRVRATIDDGDEFRVRINGGDILFSDASDQPGGDETTDRLTVVSTDCRDLLGGTTWIGPSTATLNALEVQGLRIVDGAQEETLDSLRVNINVLNGAIVDGDFQALGVDGAVSGFGMYRDDGGTDDAWDGGDDALVLTGIAGGFGVGTIDLDLDAEDVPDSDTGNFDFFFVVRTSATIATGDEIEFEIMVDDLVVDGVVDADATTPEAANGAPFLAFSLAADADPPVFDSGEWDDNGARCIHDGGGGSTTLWFSDRINGVETVTVTGTASDNVGLDFASFSNEPSLRASPGNDNSPSNWDGDYDIAADSTDDDDPVTVTLWDDVGNSATMNLVYIEDTVAPVITWNTPQADQHLAGAVDVRAAVADNSAGVDTVEMTTDGGTSYTNMIDIGPEFFATWLTPINPDGAVRVSIVATDEVCNPAVSFRNVVLDNTGPVMTITAPLAGQYMQAGVGITVDIEAEALDATAVASAEVRLDGGAWTPMVWDQGASRWTYQWADPTGGVHSVEARGTDSLGNIGGSTITVVIGDDTPPTGGLSQPVDGSSLAGSILLALWGADQERLGSVDLSLDSGLTWWATSYDSLNDRYVLALDTREWDDGTYLLHVRSTDEAGNVAINDTASLIFDNTMPSLQALTPRPDAHISGSVVVSLIAEDATSGILDGSANPRMRVDGGPWVDMVQAVTGPYQGAWNTTSLADGPHLLTVSVLDVAGNEERTSLWVTIDNTAPVVQIVSPQAGAVASQALPVIVNVDEQLGAAAVTMRLWHNGGGLLRQVWNSTSAQVTAGSVSADLQPSWFDDGNYTIEASAVDLAGTAGVSQSVEFAIDSHAPELTVLSPAPGAVVEGQVALRVDTSDTFLEERSYSVDHGAAKVLLPGVAWDSTTVADGGHMLLFRASDAAGHLSQQEVPVTVDNTAPVVAISGVGQDQFVSGTTTVMATIVERVSLAGVILRFGTLSAAMVTAGTDSSFIATVDVSQLAEGQTQVWVEAHDGAGHNSTSGAITVRVDHGPPTVELFSPAGGTFVMGTIPIVAEVTDAYLALQQWRVDNGPWMEADGPLDSRTLTDGPHMLTYRAQDLLGQQQQVSVPIEVDNTAPSVAIRTPFAGERVAGTVDIEVGVKELHTLTRVVASIGPEAAPVAIVLTAEGQGGSYRGTLPTAMLADGPVTLEAQACDEPGWCSTTLVDVIIDNSGPTIEWTSQTTQTDVLAIRVSVIDAAGVEEVVARIDGGPWREMILHEGVYRLNRPTTVEDNGAHIVEVRSTDGLDNTHTESQRVIVANPDFTLIAVGALVALVVFAVVLLMRKPRPKGVSGPPAPYGPPAAGKGTITPMEPLPEPGPGPQAPLPAPEQPHGPLAAAIHRHSVEGLISEGELASGGSPGDPFPLSPIPPPPQ